MTDKIKLSNLYKVFGKNPSGAMDHVRKGASKQELLDNHGHVLGLRDINIDIPERQIQVIMGLSGSGKSTLIRHINRLIEPTEGQVVVDGVDVLQMSADDLREFRRHKQSMVFQKFALLPHRTVAQNAAYGLTVQDITEDEAKERAQRWIDRVGLGGFENHFPAQLSGGMQQRVGLARALATDAEILLMDEAFSALDPLIRTDMQDILLDLQEELHKTIVFITHDLDEALRIGDRISILRDGEIVQQGDPQDIIMRPGLHQGHQPWPRDRGSFGDDRCLTRDRSEADRRHADRGCAADAVFCRQGQRHRRRRRRQDHRQDRDEQCHRRHGPSRAGQGHAALQIKPFQAVPDPPARPRQKHELVTGWSASGSAAASAAPASPARGLV